jgi:hypothetical protein
MINLVGIVRNNRESYYNFSTGQPLPQTISNIIKVIIALISASIFVQINKDFLGAVLSVYSILVGFSFNIIFYLIAIEKKEPDANASIEKQIKFEKLNKLIQELFYNVSYFTLISIFLVLLCLLLFLASCTGEGWGILKEEIYSAILERSINVIKFLYHTLFFLVLLESIYSFLRTMNRVNYYFSTKIKS